MADPNKRSFPPPNLNADGKPEDEGKSHEDGAKGDEAKKDGSTAAPMTPAAANASAQVSIPQAPQTTTLGAPETQAGTGGGYNNPPQKVGQHQAVMNPGHNNAGAETDLVTVTPLTTTGRIVVGNHYLSLVAGQETRIPRVTLLHLQEKGIVPR